MVKNSEQQSIRVVLLACLMAPFLPVAAGAQPPEFTGADGSFRPVGPPRMSEARYAACGTLLTDGRVAVFGGQRTDGNSSKAVDVFGFGTGQLSATAQLLESRHAVACALLADGRVLVTGGYRAETATYLSSAELYDPAQNKVVSGGTMQRSRYGHTATALANGKILLIGGGNPTAVQSSAETFDPATGSFALTGSMTTPRYGHTATLLADGRVLVAGGYNGGGYVATADVFDPATQSFSAVGNMSEIRGYHTATLLPSGIVLITGGINNSGQVLKSADLFDPSTGRFAHTGLMASQRHAHIAALLSDASGKVLVAGGYSNIALSSAEVYDSATGLFTPTQGMTIGRSGAVAVRVASNRVFIAGGLSVTNTSSSTATTDFFDAATGLFSTVLFDPRAFTPPLDQDGDGILQFEDIVIPAGLTVRVMTSSPVFWLAKKAATIEGVLDFRGGDGHNPTLAPAARIPSQTGPGGFSGGIGGNAASPPTSGQGPGGGSAGQPGQSAKSGSFSGNAFLVPLVGGSGGGGGLSISAEWGGGGGAGGGAFFLASTVGITVSGSIRADGGNSGGGCTTGGGPGSGGAIRLSAPVISGNGALSVAGGLSLNDGVNCRGGPGRIRLETADDRFTGVTTPGAVAHVAPAPLFLPATPPASLRVTKVAGQTVPANPTGSFSLADVQISQAGPAQVEIEGRGVPVGTVVELHLFSASGTYEVIQTPPLQADGDHTKTTVTVTFPSGFSRGYPRAVWR
jgi:hypothetical protein